MTCPTETQTATVAEGGKVAVPLNGVTMSDNCVGNDLLLLNRKISISGFDPNAMPTELGAGDYNITVSTSDFSTSGGSCSFRFIVSEVCPKGNKCETDSCDGTWHVKCVGPGGVREGGVIDQVEAESACKDPTFNALKPYCDLSTTTPLGCVCEK